MSVSIAGWRWWHAAVPLLLACAGCASHGGAAPTDEKKEEEHEAHVVVKTEPARLGTLTETVDGLGRSEALPDHIATLTPAVEGHVHELLVTQGDTVKKGQPIVEFDKVVARADLDGEDRDPRRAQGLAGSAQVASPRRGAEVQRAGDRAGQGGGRAWPGRPPTGSVPCAIAARSRSNSSSTPRRPSNRHGSSSRRPRPSSE